MASVYCGFSLSSQKVGLRGNILHSEGMAMLRVRCTTCLELRHRDLQRHLYLSTMMYRNEYDGHFVTRLLGNPIAA